MYCPGGSSWLLRAAGRQLSTWQVVAGAVRRQAVHAVGESVGAVGWVGEVVGSWSGGLGYHSPYLVFSAHHARLTCRNMLHQPTQHSICSCFPDTLIQHQPWAILPLPHTFPSLALPSLIRSPHICSLPHTSSPHKIMITGRGRTARPQRVSHPHRRQHSRVPAGAHGTGAYCHGQAQGSRVAQAASCGP